jgi:hypothetical protein
MKGVVIDSYLFTYIFLIVVMVALIVLGLLMVCVVLPFCPLGPAQAEYAISFLDVMNTPYTIANVLTGSDMEVEVNNVKEKKPFMDYVYESFLSGLSKEKRKAFGNEIQKILDEYDLDYYEVSIKEDGKTQSIVQVGSIQKCGSSLQGTCMERIGSGQIGTLVVGECNVGAIPIPDEGLCKKGWSCCQKNQLEYYNKYDTKLKIINCGPVNRGTCSARDTSRGACARGTIPLESYNSDCSLANQGKTPLCCSTDVESLKIENKVADAEIPLFYQDKTGYLVVTTSD